MKTNSRWMPATIFCVVLSLVTASLTPAAFGQSAAEAPQSKEPAADSAVPVVLPNRPAEGANNAVAQAILPSQTRTLLPAKAPAPQQTKGSSQKWIWIVVAAAGAGVAAAVLAGGGGDDDPPIVQTPTIVVGTPTVGQPQ